MRRSRRSRVEVLARSGVVLLGIVVGWTGPGLAGERPVDEPKPAPLPAIELPPPPPEPEGTVLAREASERMMKGDYERARWNVPPLEKAKHMMDRE